MNDEILIPIIIFFVTGRPYPLKGRYFANIFIHFQAIASRDDANIPYYIIPNNPDAENWYNDKGIKMLRDQGNTAEEGIADNPDEIEDAFGRQKANLAAMEENLTALQEMAEDGNDDIFNYADDNGWTPLHEATRTLNLDIVQFLVEHGADINARTSEDSTALDLAVLYGGDNHSVARYLRGLSGPGDDWQQEL